MRPALIDTRLQARGIARDCRGRRREHEGFAGSRRECEPEPALRGAEGGGVMARPAGEVSLALLRSAAQPATPERRPDDARAGDACLCGLEAANATVKNLKRHGKLRSGTPAPSARPNSPVAEYAPAPDPRDNQVNDDEPDAMVMAWSNWGGVWRAGRGEFSLRKKNDCFCGNKRRC
jgi:hypothetical protein